MAGTRRQQQCILDCSEIGSVEMLVRIVGHRQAEIILYSGAMHSAQEALSIGLIDRVCKEESLYDEAILLAQEYAEMDAKAF